MDKLWKVVPSVLAAAAVCVVVVQSTTIRRLERRIAATEAENDERGAGGRVVPQAGSPALEKRVASLEQMLARLLRMQLGSPTGKAAGAGENETGKKVAGLRDDVDALLTGEGLATEQGRKRLQQIVRDVQEKLEEERRGEWQKWWQQARRNRLEKLAKDAGLSANQVERLTSLLEAEHNQIQALFQGVRRGEKTFPQAMTESRTIRQASDQKAKELLDAKQVTAYEEMRKEHRRWR